jgi:hypothetical protein
LLLSNNSSVLRIFPPIANYTVAVPLLWRLLPSLGAGQVIKRNQSGLTRTHSDEPQSGHQGSNSIILRSLKNLKRSRLCLTETCVFQIPSCLNAKNQQHGDITYLPFFAVVCVIAGMRASRPSTSLSHEGRIKASSK